MEMLSLKSIVQYIGKQLDKTYSRSCMHGHTVMNRHLLKHPYIYNQLHYAILTRMHTHTRSHTHTHTHTNTQGSTKR